MTNYLGNGNSYERLTGYWWLIGTMAEPLARSTVSLLIRVRETMENNMAGADDGG